MLALNTLNPPQFWNRRDTLFLALVLITASLSRMVYFLHVREAVWFNYPIIDAWNFHTWAERIAAGNILGGGVYTQSPFYAYGLGLVYAVFGPKTVVPILIQFLLGIMNCGLIYLLGRRVLSSPVGLIAGLAGAVYGISLFHESTLITATLIQSLNLLLLLTLYWAQNHTRVWAWIVPGVFLGLSFITRPNVILILPVIFIWLKWLQPNLISKSRLWISMTIIFFTMSLMILPFTLRNLLVVHEPLLTVGTGGINFYLGNSLRSTGFHGHFGPLGQFSETILTDFKHEAENLTGKSLSYAQSSQFWFRQTLEEIRQNPSHWFKILMDKSLFFFNRYEITSNLDVNVLRESEPILQWPWLNFSLIGPLGFLGIFLLRQKWKWLFPLYGTVAAYFLVNVFIMVSSEYRYAVVPPFLIFAASGIHTMIVRIQNSEWKDLRYILGLVFVFFLLVNMPMLRHDAIQSRKAAAHYNYGSLYMSLGRYSDALKEFIEARKLMTGESIYILAHGEALFQLEQFEDSLEIMFQAYRLDPNNPKILTGYAHALTMTRHFDEAVSIRIKAIELQPDNPLLHYNLGITYLWANESEKAEKPFQYAIQLKPDLDSQIEKMKKIIPERRIKYGFK